MTDPALTPDSYPVIEYSEPMLCDGCDRTLPNVFSTDGRTLLCPECHLKQATWLAAEAALERGEDVLVNFPLAAYDPRLLELIGELVNCTDRQSRDMFSPSDCEAAAEALHDYLNNPPSRIEFDFDTPTP